MIYIREPEDKVADSSGRRPIDPFHRLAPIPC
jgi:hypothetical protein